MRRLEVVLSALCGACWFVILLDALRVVPLENHLVLGLYPLYAVAGLVGSFAGHAFVSRSKGLSLAESRRMLLVYVGGLPVIPVLLRMMAPTVDQEAAPLVPLWSIFVFAVFTIVPLTMRRPAGAGRPPAGESSGRGPRGPRGSG
ncbi:MAG: hypothetical protein ABI609_06445 [Acidobacteriota bacterium]